MTGDYWPPLSAELLINGTDGVFLVTTGILAPPSPRCYCQAPELPVAVEVENDMFDDMFVHLSGLRRVQKTSVLADFPFLL
jgi:hypothetical protein